MNATYDDPESPGNGPGWRPSWALTTVATVVGLAVLAAAPGWRRNTAEAARQDADRDAPNLIVDVVRVPAPGEHQSYRSFAGLVVARRAGDLHFPRSGRVAAMHVEVGTEVRSGQMLAELERPRLTSKRDGLRAALDAAKAEQQRLTPAKPAATVNDVRLEIRRMQQELDRLDRQLAQQPAAAPAPDLARLRTLQEQQALLDQSARQERARAAARRVAELDAQLKDAELEWQEGSLAAPFDGAIAACYVESGAAVSPAAPILRLVETSALRVRVKTPLAIADRLQIGDRCEASVAGHTTPLTLIAKLPELDRTARTRSLVFAFSEQKDLSGAGQAILAGAIAHVRVPEQRLRGGVWLPRSALESAPGGEWSVYVAQPIEQQLVIARRPITILANSDQRVFVRGSLSQNELVVAHGAHRVTAGQQVRIGRELALDDAMVAGDREIAKDGP